MTALRPAGKYCAKYGSARISLLSGVAIAATLLPFGVVNKLPLFCLSLFLFGFANATQDIAINSHAVGLERVAGRRMMVTFHGMWSVGALIGGGISAIAIHLHITSRFQYLIEFLLLLPIIYYTKSRFLANLTEKQSFKSGKRTKKPKIILALGCLGLCASLGEGSSSDWGGILAKETFHASAFVATLPYIFFMSGMIIGRFSGDKLAERYGIRSLLMFSGAIYGFGLSIGLIIGNIFSEIFAWMCVGLGVAAVIPIIVSTTGSLVLNEHIDVISPSEAVAMVTAINYSGFFFGPILIGLLSDQITLRWAMLVPAFLGVALSVSSRKIIKVD
jgi:MFS family permease